MSQFLRAFNAIGAVLVVILLGFSLVLLLSGCHWGRTPDQVDAWYGVVKTEHWERGKK